MTKTDGKRITGGKVPSGHGLKKPGQVIFGRATASGRAAAVRAGIAMPILRGLLAENSGNDDDRFSRAVLSPAAAGRKPFLDIGKWQASDTAENLRAAFKQALEQYRLKHKSWPAFVKFAGAGTFCVQRGGKTPGRPLHNKIALVTGAARGIGQAIAVQLASDGADLALCDVKAEWLADTLAKVKALGRRAEGYAMDVANAAAVGEAVAKVLADFGRIDVLVNNAGITRDTLLIRMTEEDWDAVLDINLKGAFLTTKAVVKSMMKQRSGAIVNIASVVGIMGNPGQANYTASKAGLIALTKTTAKEMGSRNIRVNAVAPGFIRTAMTDKLSEPVKDAMLKMVPLGRLGEPEDVAKAVAFLASDNAAYVNGQTLAVCGGMVW